MNKIKIPAQSPLKQIRKQCVDCCQSHWKTIDFCASVDCSLWYLRFGKRPKTVIKRKGVKSKQLFDKDNFKVGGKFSPDIEVENFKL